MPPITTSYKAEAIRDMAIEQENVNILEKPYITEVCKILVPVIQLVMQFIYLCYFVSFAGTRNKIVAITGPLASALF